MSNGTSATNIKCLHEPVNGIATKNDNPLSKTNYNIKIIIYLLTVGLKDVRAINKNG